MVEHREKRIAQLAIALLAELVFAVTAVPSKVFDHLSRTLYNRLGLEIDSHYVDLLQSSKIADLTLALQTGLWNFFSLSIRKEERSGCLGF